ncbi:hypothetical protein Ocin01_05377 [Orchesella cincta]|uniref:Protein takeout n=1 Tax=Orchesella cincta TaxID=48709 RepID=A0A1D2N7U0_ORCCI|nr:hypothetical protein Ocin01_05377 [Orchesella cincta]
MEDRMERILIAVFVASLALQCLGQTQTSPTDQSANLKIADYIVKSLEAFRKYMVEGNQEIQLPVLDPVPMESFNYSLINGPIGFRMEITFENPSITGLSKYELTNVTVTPSDNGQDLKMTILFPHIEIKGLYDATGNVFGFFSLAGNGEFDVVASDQVLSADAVLKVINDTYFIEDISSTFSQGRVKAHFSDNHGKGDFNGLFGEMLSAMGNLVFNNRLKPVITAAMNEFTKDWLNGAFGAVTINDFFASSSQSQARVMSEAVSAVAN